VKGHFLRIQKQILSKKLYCAAATVVLIGVAATPIAVYNQRTAYAVTIDELRSQSDSLQQQIDQANKQAQQSADVAATIQERISQLQTQIDQANNQIQLTGIKLQELDLQLQQTQDELDRQKALLKASLQALYKKGGASTMELLVGSDSFSQFINDQTYLQKLKDGIQTSAEKVLALKQQIQDQQQQQKELLAQQEAQKSSLEDTKSQQAQLLATTQGQQAKYQQMVAELQAKQKEIDDELTALIRAGNMVSLGRVHRGQMIGRIGMTGFTFGPHLHFEVRDSNNSTVNPLAYGTTLIAGFSWPVASTPEINQYYGCGAPYSWYFVKCNNGTSLHPGLDIGGVLGTPVLAPADGDIIINSDQGDGYGHKVIIRQDNGYYTYYGHLQN
jgi:septal ring factor EnvC (AmiA/AmiB activator)